MDGRTTRDLLERGIAGLLPATLAVVLVFVYLHNASVAKFNLIGGALFFNSSGKPAKAQEPAHILAARDYERIVFFPSSGPNFEAIRAQAQRNYDGDLPLDTWIGVFELKGGGLAVYADPYSLAGVLENVENERKSVGPAQLALLVALLSIAVGALFAARGVAPSLSYFVLAGAVLSLLFVTRCKTCNVTDEVLGIDRAALGSGLFFLLAGITPSLSTANRRTLAVVAAGLIGSYQVVLFLDTQEVCIYCLVVLGFSSAVVGSALGRHQNHRKPLSSAPTRREFRAVWLTGGVTLAVTSLWLGRHTENGVPLLSWTPVLGEHKAVRSLLGTSVDDLDPRNARGQELQLRGCALLIGTDSCPPCLWAARDVLQWPGVEILIAAHNKGALTTAGPFSAVYLSNPPPELGTPTLLTVDKTGRVVEEVMGWSNDKRVAEHHRKRAIEVLAGEDAP